MADFVIGPDGLIAQKDLGSWTTEKHDILRKYVGIASGPRQGFLRPLKPGLTPAGGVYIDLYCATGLGQLKDTKEFVDGSAVVAWKESVAKKAPFSKVIIGDAHEESLRACENRLRAAGCTNIVALHGTSDETVLDIKKHLNPSGLHFAFLDPFSLAALPFTVIKELLTYKRMDLLIHVSTSDLQRNLDFCLTGKMDSLDRFAPGWKEAVPVHETRERQKHLILEYWKKLISEAGGDKRNAEHIPHLKGSKNQTLYWLILVTGHKLAHEFWEKINQPEQGGLF